MKFTFWLLPILLAFSCKKDKVSENNVQQHEGSGVLLGVTGGCVRFIYVTSGLEFIDYSNHELWRKSKDSIITSTRLDTIFNYLFDTTNVKFKYGDSISFVFREDIDQLGMCFYDGSWINYYPNVFITQIKKLK
ncbi:MAG: hypothetical protein K9I36_09140 [Bacteroidia bacterium]|nr:hypothetical protein [Bacteroidia bacterium]MCF8426883.1 hypothetical protein [Bacteroidia bacterium]